MQNISIFYVEKGDKEEYLKDLVKQFDLQEKVVFAGYRNDIREILKISNIFCFPSYREGLSLALMEAMAVGLPVICSNIRGNIDLIDDNKGGYLCKPSQIDIFRDSIDYLITHADIRNDFGIFNKKRVKQFDVSEISKYMKKIYKNI